MDAPISIQNRDVMSKRWAVVFVGLLLAVGLAICGEADAQRDTTVVLPGGATMEMARIEPGTFLMGAPESDFRAKEWERPQHKVTISEGFYLGKYEVTQGQWEAVMDTQPWIKKTRQTGRRYPAVWVSWDDVQAFVQKLNEMAGSDLYRLPTEAEWEYACRAGTTTSWSFGDDWKQLGAYAWYKGNTVLRKEEHAHEVGTKQPNPWGLYDMYGNVWEWAQDWWGPYPAHAQVDPTGPASGSSRVGRGGGFNEVATDARSAYRGHDAPTTRSTGIGFRLVRQVE